ncbi:MAG: serine/threonine protein kinase [Prevotella sp.]|nr:serine/threonine protein kinase [Prevotella sp.]
MNALKTNAVLQNGKYRIEGVLGQGGFGITYLASQVALNRKVTIKEFFMKELCNRAEQTSQVSVPSMGSVDTVARFRAKFVKEAQTIAALNNPHIIHIHDIFEENGTAYYVMDYLSGGSLSDLVQRDGVLAEATALGYIRQVADALSYIHARNINHLDIKPSNVLIDGNGNAVVIDFGLSKRYDETGSQTSTTPVGISHGFAPLEQYQPGGVSTFSPTTDIYSLGATLYKLLSGQTPPNATALLDADLDLSRLSASLSTKAAIAAAMHPKRKGRPQTVEAFIAMLDEKVAPDVAVPLQATVDEEATVIAHEPEASQPKVEKSVVKSFGFNYKRVSVAFVVIFVSMYLIDSLSGYYLGPGVKSVAKTDYYDLDANFFQMIFITGEGFAPNYDSCITHYDFGLGTVLSTNFSRVYYYYAGLGAYLVVLLLLMALCWVVKRYRAKQWVLFCARYAIVPIAINYMPLCWFWIYSIGHRGGTTDYTGVNYFHLFFLFAFLSIYAFGLDSGRPSAWQLFKRWWKDANIKRGVLVFVAEIALAIIIHVSIDSCWQHFSVFYYETIEYSLVSVSSWLFALSVSFMLFWLVNKCKSYRALLVARYAVFPSILLVQVCPVAPRIIPWFSVFGSEVGAEFLYSLTPYDTFTISYTLLLLSALAFTSKMPKEK